MKHDEFHRIVLMLASQIPLRYWNYFNHHSEPQQFAISFYGHVDTHLHEELIKEGFWLDDKDGMYKAIKTL